MKNPNIVLLGGGTGSFTLLQALKKLSPDLTAIVNMSDDGGSTGTLRDELGVLPPGDARQCLVALSDSPEIRNLFNYRFEEGGLAGHTVGNLILSALEVQYGSFQKAVEVASDILRITGRVLPVTSDKHTLVVEDGEHTYRGEHVIDGAVPLSATAKVWLEPAARIGRKARDAVLAADMVVIAPGSLHSSLLPIFAVTGMAEALQATKATIVSVTNLVNKPLQTESWHVVDYVLQLERYIGTGQIDVVLYNNEPISADLLQKYAAEGEFPVLTTPDRFVEIQARAVGAPLVSKEISAQNAGDKVRRTLIRHDTERVCDQLRDLLSGR